MTVLFVVTNGAGLGHLTRGLAVARRLRQLDETIEIIFCSTSLATEVIREMGFMYYYLPTKHVMPKSTTNGMWNKYLSQTLEMIIEVHHPHMVVYDGVYPYSSLISTLNKHKLIKIWLKRESYKAGTDDGTEMEKRFSLTIVPGEAGLRRLPDTAKKKYVNPIILLDKEEAHQREAIRDELKISYQNKLFYVQLGAGVINDTNPVLHRVIDLILKNPENRILLGESIIGKHLDMKHQQLTTIRSYPNSQYFKAIDYAVSASGYNTFHELLYYGVPSIFIPNTQTSKDDQVARVKRCTAKKACLMAYENKISETTFNQLIQNERVFRKNSERLIPVNGALEAAQIILNEGGAIR